MDPDRAAYVLEAGSYLIRVGSHSRGHPDCGSAGAGPGCGDQTGPEHLPLDVLLEELRAAGATPTATRRRRPSGRRPR